MGGDGIDDAAKPVGGLEEGDGGVREALSGIKRCCQTGDPSSEYCDPRGLRRLMGSL